MGFLALRLAVPVVIVMACLTVATGQLPCDSVLRRLPSFSHLFTHCECLYSEWTDWVATSRRAVPTSQCPSGSALIRERSQRVISGECDDKTENSTICEPDMIDRLILTLGLGSSGHDISPDPIVQTEPSVYYASSLDLIIHTDTALPGFTRFRTPRSLTPVRRARGEVCQHISDVHVHEKRKRRRINSRHHSTAEPERLPTDPTPFNMQEHGGRYRRQSQCDHQYILFVLDTSGSIGMANFNRVTSNLGTLIPLFCDHIKIAVMTFDHEYFVEFCFNKYNNTGGARQKAGEAISSIPYIREGQGEGTRWTHTAGAAQCVCEHMLHPNCGLHPAARCIDVVFITDGHANDPTLNVCSTVDCLHSHDGVNTYAIGIGNLNQLKLNCMIKTDLPLDEYHLFNFPSFDDLERDIQQTLVRLSTDPTYYYSCVNTTGGVTDQPPTIII